MTVRSCSGGASLAGNISPLRGCTRTTADTLWTERPGRFVPKGRSATLSALASTRHTPSVRLGSPDRPDTLGLSALTDSRGDDHMSGLRTRGTRGDGDRRLPALVHLRGLRSASQATPRRLLRVLLVRARRLSAATAITLGILALLLLLPFPLGDLVPRHALEEAVLVPDPEEAGWKPPFDCAANGRPAAPAVRVAAALVICAGYGCDRRAGDQPYSERTAPRRRGCRAGALPTELTALGVSRLAEGNSVLGSGPTEARSSRSRG
jgi:hypothetical protein